MLKQMYAGFIRMHILHHAAHAAIYGAEMIEELKRHGYSASPGTIYPVLHQMEKDGYLRSLSQNVNGKIRIYYDITSEGQQLLMQSKEKLKELAEELLD